MEEIKQEAKLEEANPAPVVYVKNRAIHKMIRYFERQEGKLLRRMDRLRFTIVRNRDRLTSLKKTLELREAVRRTANADNQSTQAA